MLLKGAEFDDLIGPVVQEVVGGLVQAIGEKRCYTEKGRIKFALRPPTPDLKRTGGILVIRYVGSKVFLRRAMPPKSGPKQIRLSPDTIQRCIALGKQWYEEVAYQKRVRQAKKNPPWKRDELILALDVYFKTPPWTINVNDAAVSVLSHELQLLSAYLNPPDAPRYRNANGCYMKLMNFVSLDSSREGKGLSSAGTRDREVWAEFSDNRPDLVRLAQNIRALLHSKTVNKMTPEGDYKDEPEAYEGALVTRVHRFRERQSKLTQLKKHRRLIDEGCLKCEVCEFDFFARYGERGKDFIECHHTVPLFELPEHKKNSLKDLALLCANCHRMVHRSKRWLTVQELRGLIRSH